MTGADYKISYDDLILLYEKTSGRIQEWQDVLESVIEDINSISNTESFDGDGAENIKAYLSEVHGICITALIEVMSEYSSRMLLYIDGYSDIDESSEMSIKSGDLQYYYNKVKSSYEDFTEIKEDISSALEKISDICDLSVSTGTLFENLQYVKKGINSLDREITEFEESQTSDLASLSIFIAEIKQMIRSYLSETESLTKYQAGDYLNNSYTVQTIEGIINSENFIESNSIEISSVWLAQSSKMMERIAELNVAYEEACEERSKEGLDTLINSVLICIGAGIAVVCTLGAALPIAALSVEAVSISLTEAIAIGSVEAGGLAYGVSNGYEGAEDLYLGLNEDLETEAFNPIRDTIFSGDQISYDIWGNASLMAGLLAFEGSAVAVEESVTSSKGAITEDIIEKIKLDYGIGGEETAYSGEEWYNYFVDKYGKENVQGSFYNEIKYQPSTGAKLEPTEGKTTTILGKIAKDTGKIKEETGDFKSLDFGNRDGGFNILNVPDELYEPQTFWENYNKPWLSNAVERGDIIKIATEPTEDNLFRVNWYTGEKELSAYGYEIKYLKEQGYIYDSVAKEMIKK